MNRKDEYIQLLTEIENTPVELTYTLTRANQKLKSQSKRRFFIVPLSSIASFFIVFIILVNSSTTFVYACERIPLIKELAQLVAFSPSLSAILENDYVQPMKLEQSKNDITVRVEYVIVDQKQLDIFYSLDSKVYSNMDATPEIRAADGKNLEGYTLSSGSFDVPNAELRHITASFLESDMPNGMQLTLKVHSNDSFVTRPIEPAEPAESIDWSGMDDKYTEPDYIAEFSFTLEFDPYYTAQGETIALDQKFEIDGQMLTAATIEIYPTHMRLNFMDHTGNTAWLQSLEFYVENEKGERYEPISNGITATGSPDSPMMASHRLESAFFSNSKELTMYITDVKWLDKNMEKIRLDLKNKAIEALPQNVVLEEIERKGNNWVLEFSGKEYEKNASYQLWTWTYYDEENNEYHINGMSSYSNSEHGDEILERFNEKFVLRDYPYDIVYLSPAYSRIVNLATPIKIKIK